MLAVEIAAVALFLAEETAAEADFTTFFTVLVTERLTLAAVDFTDFTADFTELFTDDTMLEKLKEDLLEELLVLLFVELTRLVEADAREDVAFAVLFVLTEDCTREVLLREEDAAGFAEALLVLVFVLLEE
ncbi:MAG: hypothetical protein E7L17_01635 [Clostridium sp.]|uniref:hypothetical protein n=1 Tax=Clostridium sp. TaxID=1506 RepID=UPI002909F8F7|nr:hypothetical protein [Clostridium sp.]MDU7336797.1 hypothetical protein [Clostridium sp.]